MVTERYGGLPSSQAADLTLVNDSFFTSHSYKRDIYLSKVNNL